MKRFVAYLVFIGLVGGLAACSGDGPTANPVPTVVPDSWTVNVTANPASQFVGNVVTLTAEVGKNGSAAPDGTTVIFQVSGAEVGRVATESGFAVTGFSASVAGTYTATARVNNVFDSTSVTFSERDPSDALEIHQALPSEGSYDGGEQVTLYGKGILQPVEVTFEAAGGDYDAEVVSVQESDPLESAGSVTVRTPYFGGLDRTIGLATDVTVVRGVGTDLEDQYTLTGAYTLLAEAPLQIIQPLVPNSGAIGGGDLVRLNGRGIRAPARVVFIVDDGTEYPADVQTVVESVPLSAMGYIEIITPYLSAHIGSAETVRTDVRVEVAIDQPGEEPLTETLPGAFVFGASLGSWVLNEPSLYLLIEDHGASAGGETVTVLGRNLRAFKYANGEVVDTARALAKIEFGSIEGQVLSVSADGTQAQVLTPRFSVTPLETDQPVDVRITTQYRYDSSSPEIGPYTATKQNAYIFLADEPTPELTGLAPIAGPLDGGTIVTLFGHGFQVPVQVTFGDLECENVNVIDDQSLADADTITCEAPDYSQQNEIPPVEVDVVVRNVLSGKVSNALIYTYGDNLYITGNTPTEGRRGDVVIIYGSGFEDPLAVDFLGGGIRMDVLAVSGTELLVRFPLETDPTCTNRSGQFRVTLFERDGQTALGTAEGGSFNYLGNTPIVANVSPLFVESFNDGDGVSPSSIVITGQHFSDEVLVDIGNYRMSNNDVDVVDEGTIEVDNIPAPNDFALVWDTMPCTTGDGFTGIRNAPTPVDIRVTNFPAECPDTLTGAIIYEPDNTDCVVAPNLVVTAPNFVPDTPFPSCSPATPMTIQNSGQGTLDIQTITLLGAFFFDAGGTVQLGGPLTLDPFAITSVDVYFCPEFDDGATYVGQAVFVSNDPDSPTAVNLSGTELVEALISTAPFGDGDIWTFAQTAAGNCSPLGPGDSELTISNTGDFALTGTLSASGPFDVLPAAFNVAVGASQVVNVQFCPVNDDGTLQNGVLTITSNAANTPNISITLRGQETP